MDLRLLSRALAVLVLPLATACFEQHPLFIEPTGATDEQGATEGSSASEGDDAGPGDGGGTDSASGTGGDGTETGSTSGGSAGGCTPNDDCLDLDGDGYGEGMACAGPDCDDHNAARFDGCYYLAPDGVDAAVGGSQDAPWRSFAYALARLEPGDSLVLRDGVYAQSTGTGRLMVDCTGGNAAVGMPDLPISVTAENARAARVEGEGLRALFVDGCSDWSVSGLELVSGDLVGGDPEIARVTGSRDVVLHDMLVHTSNGAAQSVGLSIDSSTRILVEDVELYDFDGNGFSIADSTSAITLRRCYANQRADGQAEISAATDASFLLRGKAHVVENCVSDGPVDHGFLVEGNGVRVRGSIAIGARLGMHIRNGAGEAPNELTEVDGFVAVGSIGHGLVVQAAVASRLFNVTLAGGTGPGFGVVGQPPLCANMQACGFELHNALVLDNDGTGVEFTGPGLVTHSNAYGNQPDFAATEPIDDQAGVIRSSMSIPAEGVGVGASRCAVWVPDPEAVLRTAGEDGASIGAELVYRIVDGMVTDDPLWAGGGFPCGADLMGEGDRCQTLGDRLGVANCALPYDDENDDC